MTPPFYEYFAYGLSVGLFVFVTAYFTSRIINLFRAFLA